MGPMFTMAPGKGAKIEVDPRKPMVWGNGRENNHMKNKRAIRAAAHNQVLLLLELP